MLDHGKQLKRKGQKQGARYLCMLGAAMLLSSSTEVMAQSDPTLIGAGQRPFVIMVVDSSSSMDFSLEGERRFPCHSKLDALGNPTIEDCDDAAAIPANNPPNNSILGDPSLFEWVSGSELGDSDNDFLDRGQSWGEKDYENPGVGPMYVGPCMVWKDACSDYSRPPWYPGMLEEHSNENNDEFEYDSRMWERLRAMRGVAVGLGPLNTIPLIGIAPQRLTDNNQPRHVQIKEILTGDMILRPEVSFGLPEPVLNPERHGPGCWFVPRMSGSRQVRSMWHACAEVDDANNSVRLCNSDGDCSADTRCQEVQSGTSICVRMDDPNHTNAFHNMVDRQDPIPHIQEVYDEQLQTGLMDNMANTAIFAVAMFDGSQGRIDGNATDPASLVREPNHGSTLSVQDNLDKQPLLNDGVPDGGGGTYTPENVNSYDLGVYKIIGPAQLDIPSSQLTSLSSFTQYAIQDAGYLRNFQNDNEAKKWRIDPANSSDSLLDYNFSSGLEKYVQPFQMGHQPLSGATPLAAAIRDIHMFMLHGQKEFDRHGRAQTPNQANDYDPTEDKAMKELNKDSKNYVVNPVQQDPYKRCRPKHVVMMTDGFPEPEKPSPSPVNLEVGSDRLTETFGFTDAANRYVYENAENEIRDLVDDMNLNDVEGNNPLFLPRVHIVGLNLIGVQECASNADCVSLGSSMTCAEINARKICAVDHNNNSVPDHPEKLGRMAAAGNTCAQWQLVQGDGKKYVPSTWPSIGGMSGTCDPTNDNCLVRQLPDGDPATYTANDGTTVSCIAPALILEQNDRFQAANAGSRPFRDDLTEALQLVFNQVLGDSGGVASRTRATIINSLDDTTQRGQYRTFSGVDVQGSSVFWKGILERQTLSCDTSGGSIGGVTSVSLSDQIDGQVRPNMSNPSGFEDNRRIFTTMSETELDGSVSLTGSNVAFHGHPLKTYMVPEKDEFQNTHFTGGNSSNALVRIPMELETLLNKLGISIPVAGESDFLSVLNTTNEVSARETINVLRGRVERKMGRVLGAILNSNPISVGPPNQDLAIGSYRAFRERYGRRTSMLYVATLDGLLHAIHTGEGNVPAELGVMYSGVNGGLGSPSGDESNALQNVYISDTDNQREAWAYAPEMLRYRYSTVRDRQPNLMDGSPVVADVRLCDPQSTANQNKQACAAAAQAGVVPAPDQWRTVLVQGLGNAGAGYFAMDVTHTGGPGFTGVDRRPDPIPLWEFDWDWEQRQILALKERGLTSRYGYSASISNSYSGGLSGSECANAQANISFSGQGVDDLQDLPFMGLSVGDASIGTVVLDGVDTADSTRRIQRPVAIFSGGLNGELHTSGFGKTPNDCVAEERRGRAVYVVDLQTGSLLRRFVDYTDPTTSDSYRFQAEVAGTPVAYDNRIGVVSNRAFVGDVAGRLFRMDLNDPDPANWTMELMFDPCGPVVSSCSPLSGNDTLLTAPRNVGPASFAPAVALDNERRVTVVYGLGERSDVSTASQTQAMIAVRERVSSTDPHELEWFTTFQEDSSPYREKLTGPPVIFNYGVYFTSFVERKDNVCEPGLTRIWGLQLRGERDNNDDPTFKPLGALDFRTDGAGYLSSDIEFSDDPATGYVKWYEPQDPMLIRGVTVAFPPDCSENIDTPGMNTSGENQTSVPELIATTSKTATDLGDAYAPNGNSDLSTGNVGANLKFQSKRLAPPKGGLTPLSWFVVGL